jgi:hypothetical protein
VEDARAAIPGVWRQVCAYCSSKAAHFMGSTAK